MPHDLNADEHWHEPTGLSQKAGLGEFKRPPMPYDVFMEEQEIPIVRAVGVSKVQDLPLKPWTRMGGRGTFIQLWGTEGLWGSYVVEVPGAGALNVETAHVRGAISCRRRPGNDRGLAGRRQRSTSSNGRRDRSSRYR